MSSLPCNRPNFFSRRVLEPAQVSSPGTHTPGSASPSSEPIVSHFLGLLFRTGRHLAEARDLSPKRKSPFPPGKVFRQPHGGPAVGRLIRLAQRGFAATSVSARRRLPRPAAAPGVPRRARWSSTLSRAGIQRVVPDRSGGRCPASPHGCRPGVLRSSEGEAPGFCRRRDGVRRSGRSPPDRERRRPLADGDPRRRGGLHARVGYPQPRSRRR